MQQRMADGTIMDCEFIFLALDVAEDINKLTSLELTAAYINEVREIEHTHFETLQGRIGRFPQTIKDENGKTITNSASRKKKEAIDKAVPNATTKQKHLLYEALGVSEKVW